MNAIKTEDLDVYALIDRDNFVVTLLLDNKTIATFEYPIAALAKDVVASLSTDSHFIEGDDVEDAYETIDALEQAAEFINRYVRD